MLSAKAPISLSINGLKYVDSWVEANHRRCFQLMECDEVRLFDEWTARWTDLVDFEIVAVLTSKDAAAGLQSGANLS